MSSADQDRYFIEMAIIGRALGADPLPQNRRDARRLMDEMRSELVYDMRTRELAQVVLAPPSGDLMTARVHKIMIEAASDLMPEWARQMHGIKGLGPSRVMIRPGTYGIARTLRWAFNQG